MIRPARFLFVGNFTTNHHKVTKETPNTFDKIETITRREENFQIEIKK